MEKGEAEPIHYKINIHDFDPTKVPFKPDVIWASPPCKTFSIMSCMKHWTTNAEGKRVPATKECKHGIEMVKRTIEIIEHFKPRYWFIENPRGMLRKQDFMQDFHRNTVTYCRYGHPMMKPTDIWTNCLEWKPRPMCKKGMPCHEASPRGSSRGGVVRQKNSYERSKIPQQLCLEIMSVCKKALEKQKSK